MLAIASACDITPPDAQDAGAMDAAILDAALPASDASITPREIGTIEAGLVPTVDARVMDAAAVFDVVPPARDLLLLATSLSVGASAACAVTPGQEVYCWGVLDGTSALAGKARIVPGLKKATFTTVGDTHACAAAEGLRCWGKPGSALNVSSLGAAGSSTPVLALANGIEAGAGSDTTCGISGANATCWGAITMGKPGIVQLDVGGTRVCGVSSEEHLYCWSGAGQSAFTDHGENHGYVSCGAGHCCGSVRDGTTECWGNNQQGQCGQEPSATIADPTVVPNLRAVVQVSAGLTHSCGLRGVGEVWCWGESYGAKPVRVTLPTAAQVEAGHRATCALLADQSIVCWALNAKPAFVELAK